VRKAIGLLANARKRRLAIRAGLGQLDGESQPGQRRAQLVRDVLKQSPFRLEERRDLPRHQVE
jgi:hypothetical protein